MRHQDAAEARSSTYATIVRGLEHDVERVGGFGRRWPNGEPVMGGLISIKTLPDVLERFKRICRDNWRTYTDMLGILMDRYEGK